MNSTGTFKPILADAPRGTLMHVALIGLLGVGIVLMRWICVSTFGTDTPFWDQWDGEVAMLYKPFLEGTLTLSQFFAPHNEHRIAFSRAFNLLLFWANGYQFDNLVEGYANAILYALSLLVFAVPVMRRLSGANLLLCSIALFVVGVAPYAVDNLLTGFQNAFFFMHAFAVGAIALVTLSDRRWAAAAALVLALASLFTLAAGLLSAPVVVFAALLRWRNGQWSRAMALTTSGVALAIFALGVLLLPSAPQHDSLATHSVGEFVASAINIASWPLPGGVFWLLALWWPSAVMLWRLAVHADRHRAAIDFYLVAVAAWTLLQALAMAHSRGHEMTIVASRYGDTLALAPLANLAIALRLVGQVQLPALRNAAMAAFAASTLLCTIGLVRVTLHWSPALVMFADSAAKVRDNLRAYLGGQGAQAFEGKPALEVSYPVTSRLVQLLEDPTVRSMLPPSVQTPAGTSLAGACEAFEAFGAYPTTPPAAHAWGSYRAGLGNPAVGTCRSAPFRIDRPYLAVRMAGYPLHDGMSLVLEDTNGGLTSVVPVTEPHESWLTATVPNPGTSVAWVATDRNPEFWFAFTAPVGVGRLSMLRQRIAARLDIVAPGRRP